MSTFDWESGWQKLKDGDVQGALDSPVSAGTTRSKEDRVRSFFGKAAGDAKDAAAVGALTFGDLLYDASAIDPKVLEAADFAYRGEVGGRAAFGQLAEDQLTGTAEQIEGRIIRLRGYVGERVAANSLREQGYEVSFPDSAQAPGHDIVVDGQAFQVKCTQGIEVIEEHFDKYPDVPVLANAEVVQYLDQLPEHFQSKVYFINGFSLEEVDSITRESLDAGAELFDFEVPYIAVAMGLARNMYGCWQGERSLANAAVRVGAEVAGRAAVGIVGAHAGKLAGLLLFGPAGGVIIGAAGAIFGASQGRKLFDWGASLVARKERTAAREAAGALLVAAREGLEKKVRAFQERQRQTRELLAVQDALDPMRRYFEERLASEADNHEQGRNELAYYATNIEKLGGSPGDWAIRSLDLVQVAPGPSPGAGAAVVAARAAWRSIP